MRPLELGARGRRGSRRELRRWRSPRLRIAVCVRDRRAEAPWQRARAPRLRVCLGFRQRDDYHPRGLGAPIDARGSLLCAAGRCPLGTRGGMCPPPATAARRPAQTLQGGRHGTKVILYIACFYAFRPSWRSSLGGLGRLVHT